MEHTNCKIQQKLNELINKSNEIKKELDETPHQDKKRFVSLLSRLLKVHKDMDEINGM
ncbi:hypothetical protein [Peribacillus kribbensis]|uniref:hypothetical protein n=1 Tax=Peribacillus kribbensis TaxID=356658 RepID=UPI000425BFC0|nr:hypothetical protein [Peribacillus kribbensis]